MENEKNPTLMFIRLRLTLCSSTFLENLSWSCTWRKKM